jgi:CHAD domain-containing protein
MRLESQPAGIVDGEPGDALKHLDNSLETQWRRYRKRLKHCQKRFTEDAVHEFRVEIRRLLATFELLRAFLPKRDLDKVHRLLKKQLDTFDQLRDTQVQSGYVATMTRRFPLAKPFRRWLCRREARFTRRARQAVKRMKTRRLRRRIAEFQKEIARLHRHRSRTRALGTALKAVDHAFERVVRCRRRVKAEDTLSIHRTRVAFKRFRYMVEGLSPVLPGITRKLCRAMHAYQSMMGDIQDTEVLLSALEKFLDRRNAAGPSGRKLLRELRRRKRSLIRTYLNAADQLDQFWPIPAPNGSSPAPERKNVLV